LMLSETRRRSERLLSLRQNRQKVPMDVQNPGFDPTTP
jgi:hypothetical protein